jgi:hypothetical protein
MNVATSSSTNQADTPIILPDFANEEEYLQYMESVAALPKGFATGTADGTFISKEAPGMGKLPIRGTVIHLTEGPTKNWAAVFTSNKVRLHKNKIVFRGIYDHTRLIASLHCYLSLDIVSDKMICIIVVKGLMNSWIHT